MLKQMHERRVTSVRRADGGKAVGALEVRLDQLEELPVAQHECAQSEAFQTQNVDELYSTYMC